MSNMALRTTLQRTTSGWTDLAVAPWLLAFFININ